MSTDKQHIITATVINESGVLTRISGLFARRCFNIDSLIVCNTENPEFSRMTIVVRGDDDELQQVTKQLAKLVDCVSITQIAATKAVLRELLLVRVEIEPSTRPEIDSVCRTYEAKIVDLSPHSVVIELTGKPTKIDGFIDVLKPYGIIELSRTGVTALKRGGDN